MSAKLIVFEGIDGSGKTTISRRLAAEMRERFQVTWLREPGDSQWGREIRRLANSRASIPPEEELRLFIEDRRYNVSCHILPALESGHMVIMDRYFYSTACYQGARGLDMEEILKANRCFAPEADMVLIVDVDVETALERIRIGRENASPLFETRRFLQKVRDNYLSLRGKHIHIVDGSGDPDTVYQFASAMIFRKLFSNSR